MRLILLLVVVGFLVWLFWPSQPTPAPSPAPTQATTPRETPTAPTATPREQRREAAPRASGADRVAQLARREGVQARVTKKGGGKALLEVAWQGSNAAAGGDFVMALYREGVIGSDFEQSGGARAGYDRSGKRVWVQGYRVSLR